MSEISAMEMPGIWPFEMGVMVGEAQAPGWKDSILSTVISCHGPSHRACPSVGGAGLDRGSLTETHSMG